jgi:ATPase subunit of ABC transporter with duplicated ATPase domains
LPARSGGTGYDALLLDGPTNDLEVDTLRALEDALTEFAGCAVIISHDRWFLDRLATHILSFEGDSHVEWSRATSRRMRRTSAPPLCGRDGAAPHQVPADRALGFCS